MIRTIGTEPGLSKIRVFNAAGRVSYSTDSLEVGVVVDRKAEACIGCHENDGPSTTLPETARSRYLRAADGSRVLALTQPIRNEPACSEADCHAHPRERQILGVLDTQLSLADLDRQAQAMTRALAVWLSISLALVIVLSIAFLEGLVLRPIGKLRAMTNRIARGDLDHEIKVETQDELGELAGAFNRMTGELKEARHELTEWGRRLELRVEEKTKELERAHEHVIRVERMASIGKLAAIVAHEINNPLAGIRTYALLLQRRAQREAAARAAQETPGAGATAAPANGGDAPDILGTIASEAGRLGDIVRNLLQFSRPSPLKVAPQTAAEIAQRAVRLVQHQIDMQNVELVLDVDPTVGEIQCDGAQIQQALIALLMNALEAMREGGRLELIVRSAGDKVEIRVGDNGIGMDPGTLAHVYEPFFTTKESTSANGLGLAVVYGIVTRHHGTIAIDSAPMRGTTVTMLLPRSVQEPREAPSASPEKEEPKWSHSMTS